MRQEKSEQNELQTAMAFLGKHRRALALVSLSCALLSALISLMIPKEYESRAVVFPPANLSLDMSSENPNFGYDIEADRLHQIFQSKEIRDSVIERFKLDEYYEISRAEKDWLSKVDRKYKKDVEFKRSTFMSILISCQTKDPELSANIVNYILKMADKVREKIYKQNVRLAYAKLNEEYQAEKRITDSLYTLLQTQFKTQGISGLVLLAPSAQLNFNLSQMGAKPGEGGADPAIGADILKYRFHLDRQNDFEVRLKRTGKMLEFPVARIHVLDSAEPDYKKTYPLITLNVLVSTVFGFLLTCLYFLFKSDR
ncbi:MAG TPA: Wzz/FepE/Etk N-terminal domain-containing protein [Bacteroidia bacterium]|nr:Wzz/FepE/Etk N-terminal domain-containing protein [Bacteroidia bacterium]